MLWSEFTRHRGNPWKEIADMERRMRRMQEDVDSLFYGPPASEFPSVNLWANGESTRITTELAGIKPESIDLSVVGKTLTIKGERPAQEVREGESYHRRERWNGPFSRAIELPYTVDSDRVEAHFHNGVLTITLPRAEADKPRKITVTPS